MTPNALAENARIDELSEQYGAYLTDAQLAAFYRLLDRSVGSACRWMERCVRLLPANPTDHTRLPDEEPATAPVSLCTCGGAKAAHRGRCRACYDASRRRPFCDCGAPTTHGNRCQGCDRLAKRAAWDRWRERQQREHQARIKRLQADELAERQQGRAA